MLRKDETICAPATAPGGALSVIRISGTHSHDILGSVFIPTGDAVKMSGTKGFRVIHGEICDGGELIDEVLVTVFRGPRSYTGEDSAEISCHASPYIVRRILEILIRHGAVTAFPGEFTQRAFLNGRIDLSQAEAVADVIAASGRSAHRIAMRQMRGGFSAEIGKLRAELLHFVSLIELELDFGEEDVEFASRQELKDIVTRVRSLAGKLAGSFIAGNAIRNGIPVTIAGKPNSGKSTLLNALLMEERAIVSEIPGTTRDTVEDTIDIDGTLFRFIDTAGLRQTADIIENLGIRRTIEKLEQASVILLVGDVNDTVSDICKYIDELGTASAGSGATIIPVINKADLAGPDTRADLEKELRGAGIGEFIFISAREHSGLDALKDRITQAALKNSPGADDVIITNVRHYEALLQVSESMDRVLEGMEAGIPDDLLSGDIRQAIHYLGEITGEITTDEILGNIFRNFCIGK